jgi:ribosomal protein L6P/L9E
MTVWNDPEGFTKSLEVSYGGYRASLKGQKIRFKL